MKFKEKVFYDTRNYNEGDHWRFTHQTNTRIALEMDCESFMKNMQSLCVEGYFEPYTDGSVTHYIIKKKP